MDVCMYACMKYAIQNKGNGPNAKANWYTLPCTQTARKSQIDICVAFFVLCLACLCCIVCTTEATGTPCPALKLYANLR